MHHRSNKTPITNYVFSLENTNLTTVESCKYFGIIVDAHVDFKTCIN